MPGIAGIVDLEEKFDLEEKITGMLSLMKHESWYKVDRFCRCPMAMGKASLGIIDPHPQPVFNQDKSLGLIMYGEVYNYPNDLIRTLKKTHHSAPENHPLSVLSLIDERGIEIVKSLNGSFVLALWDFERNVLTIANDRYGLRPLYYFWQDHLFVFSSEMKSILTIPQVKKEVDVEAMAQFFSFNFVMEDRTLFKEIKIFSPASILTFQSGKPKNKSYWTFNLKEDRKGFDKKESLERAHFLIKQAVQRQLKDDIPKILSLSGGLDSRTILGAAAQLGYEIPTFTFGIPNCPDQKLAKAIADSLGMENHFFELSPGFLKRWARQGVWLTEGMSNCVNFHGIEFVPEIRKKASMVLNGFFGNEIFGVLSLRNVQLLLQKRSKRWISRFFRQINHPFPESEQINLFQMKYYSQIKGSAFQSYVRWLEDCPAFSPFNKFYYFKLGEQATKSALYGLLLDNNLLEYRVPFCDYDLVDFALTIPPNQRLFAAFYRRMLTEKFYPLDKIPYQRTGLPVSCSLSRVLFRKTKEHVKKKIFTSGADERRYFDYDNWMRGELKDFLISVLLSERFLSRGYFNPDYVRRLVEQHLSGKRNLAPQLGSLLTFELWNQLFIDQALISLQTRT